MLLFLFLIWLQLALFLFMLFFGTTALPPASEFMYLLLLTPRGTGLLVVGSIIGGAIAAFVFSISVVGVPLLLATQTDAVSAAKASFAAVARNPKPMALWAVLIAAIMAAGFMLMLVGLVIALPLIGHATWHAYQDVYGEQGGR
jgi:uncharacterized membrane protein